MVMVPVGTSTGPTIFTRCKWGSCPSAQYCSAPWFPSHEGQHASHSGIPMTVLRVHTTTDVGAAA